MLDYRDNERVFAGMENLPLEKIDPESARSSEAFLRGRFHVFQCERAANGVA